jgi:hypothetical protein
MGRLLSPRALPLFFVFFVQVQVFPQQPVNERIALLPVEQRGLTDEETSRLTASLVMALDTADRFAVLGYEEMLRILREAEFENLAGCTYSYCIADAGRVLGVGKVMHATITRRGKLYTLRLRLVRSDDAKVVVDRQTDFSGEFESLLSAFIPAEVGALGERALEHDRTWYVVAAAVVVTVGTIYSLYKVFNKSVAGEGTGGGPPQTQ